MGIEEKNIRELIKRNEYSLAFKVWLKSFLSPQEYFILSSRMWLGKTLKDLAESTGINSIGNVKKLQERAERKIKLKVDNEQRKYPHTPIDDLLRKAGCEEAAAICEKRLARKQGSHV